MGGNMSNNINCILCKKNCDFVEKSICQERAKKEEERKKLERDWHDYNQVI